MSTFPRRFVPVSLLLVCGTLLACGGASFGTTGRWRDPTRATAVHNVLVIGIADRMLYRRMYEDEFVKRFAARGVTAKASYLAVQGDNPTREQLEAAVKELGCDSALVTHVVDIQQRKEYKEGPIGTEASYVSGYGSGFYATPYYAPMYGPGFGSYYSAVFEYTHTEGYYERTNSYNLETTLYAANDGKLIWALMTQAVDPADIRDVLGGLSNTVFEALEKDGLVKPAK
ncbi:MAG TPA: hypothetical protein VJV78_38715 [Polyangiales bacterium]|nr:hypothetical protein [Polyangiales bacterium]